MARTIGVGVIGMGWMGQVHSRSYNVIKDRFGESGICPSLVICADDVEARARSARNRFGTPPDDGRRDGPNLAVYRKPRSPQS